MEEDKPESVDPRRSIPVGPRLKALIKLAWRVRKPAILEGETGIGKSYIFRTTTDEEGIGFIVVDLSILEPTDLVGLPFIRDGRTVYAAPAILPCEGKGILLLEELNRCETYMRQPALQLLTERQLHQYRLPDGWTVCAAINPDSGKYQVMPLDPALLARFMYIKVHADRKSWIDWASQNGVHPVVIKLARTDDQFLEVASPRTWTYVSDIIRGVRPKETGDETSLADALNGYLHPVMVDRVLRELKAFGGDTPFTAEELLVRYDGRDGARKIIQGAAADGHTDILHKASRLARSIIESPDLGPMIEKGEFRIEAFECFLGDLPGDHAEQLGDAFARSPFAAAAIDIQPGEIVERYSGNGLAERIGDWLQTPQKRHRGLALVTALPVHLRGRADLNKLQGPNGNRAWRANLGSFHSQIERFAPRWAEKLRHALDGIKVDLIFPSQNRRTR
jgi:hypothetical protein